MPPSPRTQPKSTGTSTLRIIGGEWRGRRLRFPEVEGLRPTPDRVRETLFNWLMPVISHANCLDLFAGSGALGLEALSRGAANVIFVDLSPQVKASILNNLQLLRCNRGIVQAQDANRWLQQPNTSTQTFNVVFLDPPFRKNLVESCCSMLEANGWLSAGALIYLEVEKELRQLPVPPNWRLHRHKEAGQVQYALFIRDEPLHSA